MGNPLFIVAAFGIRFIVSYTGLLMKRLEIETYNDIFELLFYLGISNDDEVESHFCGFDENVFDLYLVVGYFDF